MIQLVDKALEDYAIAHSTPVPPLLDELRAYTYRHVDNPDMQVGPLEGMFLKVLSRMVKAERIVEVGTFTGYSSLMMASALPEDGELLTCENNANHAAVAQRFFDRSPDGAKIKILLGPAADTLAKLEGPFDLAFIDADKGNYIRYFDLILARMRKGGVIVADNVLWSGRVLDNSDQQERVTRSVVAFNQHLLKYAQLDRIMLTVRDGMTLVVA